MLGAFSAARLYRTRAADADKPRIPRSIVLQTSPFYAPGPVHAPAAAINAYLQNHWSNGFLLSDGYQSIPRRASAGRPPTRASGASGSQIHGYGQPEARKQHERNAHASGPSCQP